MTSTRLFTHALLAFTALASSSWAAINNDYPVILVHGLFGFGRNEMLGFKYWGGLQGDLEAQLNAQGFKVMTATVGPISSNWDRACELYAQIKGGQVDYGRKHSDTHGHLQKGRTFKGLYPEWGTRDANGNIRKVHLIGHSMGGQTIRMLAQLLADGGKGAPTGAEDAAVSGKLFAGGKEDWVHSITTISTPNQGTFLADKAANIGDLVEGVVAGVLAVMGFAGTDPTLIYDAKMDHWGLAPKQPNESLIAYMQRVLSSKMFQPGFKDISLWSLSTEGAGEENAWVRTLPKVYYFAVSNQDTYDAKDLRLRNIQLPHIFTMLAPLNPFSMFLGSRYGPDHGFSESWQQNDGLVGVPSMIGDGTGAVADYKGVSYRGKWNRLRLWNRMDHGAVIGITLHTEVFSWYTQHLSLLRGLSNQATTVDSLEDEVEIMEAPRTIDSIEDLEELCASAAGVHAVSYCQAMLQAARNPASGNTSIIAVP